MLRTPPYSTLPSGVNDSDALTRILKKKHQRPKQQE